RERAAASRPRGRREGAGDRDRARLRDPVLARPPVAEAAPGVVLPPARRDAEVCREPAEALPGHLQRRLRQRELARAVAGAAGRPGPAARLEGVLPAELLREHAGHPPRVPPERRAPGLRGAARARGDALSLLRDLLRLRAVRERRGAAGVGGVPQLREVRA